MCETTCPRTQCPARRNTLVPLGPCRLAHGSGGSCAHWNGPPSSARPAHPLHPGASPRPMQSLQPAASSYSQAGRRNAGLPTSACDLRVCAEGEAGPLQSTLACLRTFASLFSDRRVPLPASSSLCRRAVPNACLLAGARPGWPEGFFSCFHLQKTKRVGSSDDPGADQNGAGTTNTRGGK